MSRDPLAFENTRLGREVLGSSTVRVRRGTPEADMQTALMTLLVGPALAGQPRSPHGGMIPKYPELYLLRANNPNAGGQHSKAARGRAKAMGALADTPDLTLPVMRGPFIGLDVELKAPGGRPTAGQRAMHERLRAEGHCVVWVDSIEDAVAAIVGYLTLPRNHPSIADIGGFMLPEHDRWGRVAEWREKAARLLAPKRRGAE